MLRDYILPELDRLPLAKVDKHNCQSIIERMKRLGRSDQTIRHCYNLMKRIFRCAFELDSFVSSNPISSVSPPKVNQGERSFLGNSEIHCLLEAAAGSRFDVPIRLALLAGLRIGEIGGEGEIRTLETLLTPTRVPGVRIQPLCHLSAIENLEASVCSNLGPQSPLSNAI
jgi:site-specific recombinase XerC